MSCDGDTNGMVPNADGNPPAAAVAAAMIDADSPAKPSAPLLPETTPKALSSKLRHCPTSIHGNDFALKHIEEQSKRSREKDWLAMSGAPPKSSTNRYLH